MFSATPTTVAFPRGARDPFGVPSPLRRRNAKNGDAAERTTRPPRRRHPSRPLAAGVGVPGDDADVPLDDTRRLGVPASESAPREPAIFVSGVSLRDDALRACAALRVQCFYRYDHENRDPDGALLFGEASERARRAWLERRLQSEMNRGRRLTDLGMRVSTFAATRAAPDAATLARERDALAQAEAEESARWDLNAPLVRQKASANDASDPSTSERFDGGRSAASAAPARCLIPPPRGAARREGARESRETEVVGTVDLHVGARLPGEFLEGALPRRGDDESDDARDDESDDARDDARETRASDGSSAVRAAASPGPEPASPPASGEGGVAVTVAAAAAFTATAASDDASVAASAALAFDLPLSAPRDGGEGYAGGGAPDGRRAYVFNVCVAPHARRLGVARRLLVAAHASAARGGVEHVYCHVERANAAARSLYESLGYVAEAEESDWLAGKLGRPPRVLMRKSLEREASSSPRAP